MFDIYFYGVLEEESSRHLSQEGHATPLHLTTACNQLTNVYISSLKYGVLIYLRIIFIRIICTDVFVSSCIRNCWNLCIMDFIVIFLSFPFLCMYCMYIKNICWVLTACFQYLISHFSSLSFEKIRRGSKFFAVLNNETMSRRENNTEFEEVIDIFTENEIRQIIMERWLPKCWLHLAPLGVTWEWNCICNLNRVNYTNYPVMTC